MSDPAAQLPVTHRLVWSQATALLQEPRRLEAAVCRAAAFVLGTFVPNDLRAVDAPPLTDP